MRIHARSVRLGSSSKLGRLASNIGDVSSMKQSVNATATDDLVMLDHAQKHSARAMHHAFRGP